MNVNRSFPACTFETFFCIIFKAELSEPLSFYIHLASSTCDVFTALITDIIKGVLSLHIEAFLPSSVYSRLSVVALHQLSALPAF